jgi:hypothetical protein
MINGKKVAVVMPAYNAGKTLEATVSELPDLDIHVVLLRRSRGRWRRRRLCVLGLLGVGRLVLLSPTICLPARDAVRHGRGGTGDDGGAGDTSEESGHGWVLSRERFGQRSVASSDATIAGWGM